ncbi:DUF559 domain-containing protein [Beduinella massiliensis]|uniref:DUF559 domain-containing protein n=1 Tax=Beduinella massiliensis TaxID=1852363 RepID=UPI0011AEF1E1
MGYEDAKRDGVKIVKKQRGSYYYPRCSICGEEMLVMRYTSGTKYTCKACKANNALRDSERRILDTFEIKERRMDNAIQRIAKVARIENYETAISDVHKRIHTPLSYESTEEIMVAIELEQKHIKYRHQVKFGSRYRADFVLPDMKVVLEVDGEIYHGEEKRTKENLRDNLIAISLGAEWEVVRIPASLINKNVTRLVSAVSRAKEKRMLIRKRNGGAIPEWYSDRR